MNSIRKIVDRLNHGFLIIVLGIGTIFSIALLTINHLGLLEVAIPIGLLLLYSFLSRRYLRSEKQFLVVLFVAAFVVRGLYTVVIKTPPISDFKLMLDAAEMMHTGSRAYLDWQYFMDWAYQIGFVVYEAVILSLSGGSLLPLKLLNCLYMSLTTLLVYGIGKEIFGEKVGRLAGILHFSYLPLIYYGPVLTNQHIGTLFYYLFIWLLTREKECSLKNGILAGISLAFGQIFRPLGIVFILGVGLYLFYGIGQRKVKAYLPYLSLVVAFILVFQMAVLLVTVTGISPNGLSNNDPYWKFVPGLNQSFYGRYNPVDNEMFLTSGTTQERQIIEKELILERLKVSPLNMLKFQVLKIGGFWGDFENSIFGLHHFEGESISLFYNWYTFEGIFNHLKAMDKVLYTIILIGAIMMVLKENHYDKRGKILLFILAFYMGIHLFIEVSVRYRYEMMGILMIVGAVGIYELINVVKRRGEINV